MKPASGKSALKVQAILGDGFEVLEFEESTRTAEEAAAAIGCMVAQIAKSLLFKARESELPVLVVASGAVRVDEKKVSRLLGEKITRADPDFVRASTGFAIGGVPPVGHAVAPVVYLDDGLWSHEAIWAAAGAPTAVFRLTPDQLAELTSGTRADVAKS